MLPHLHCVLLVDDDPAANFLHRLAIEGSGRVQHIVDATSGAAALDYLRQASADPDMPAPDLLLLDINMPGMNGWQFLDACAEQGITLPRLVSMLTTSENPDDQRRAEEHPAVVDFLTKFMETPEFVALIDRHA